MGESEEACGGSQSVYQSVCSCCNQATRAKRQASHLVPSLPFLNFRTHLPSSSSPPPKARKRKWTDSQTLIPGIVFLYLYHSLLSRSSSLLPFSLFFSLLSLFSFVSPLSPHHSLGLLSLSGNIRNVSIDSIVTEFSSCRRCPEGSDHRIDYRQSE